jgi:hypothetical protein
VTVLVSKTKLLIVKKCGFSVKITTSMLLTRKLPTDEQWQMNALFFRNMKKTTDHVIAQICTGSGACFIAVCHVQTKIILLYIPLILKLSIV